MARLGVYVILNARSNKAYIGSSVDLGHRQAHHRWRLRRGDHENPHLQRSWNKYGEDAFEFAVLEYVDDPEGLHLAEQEWMDRYREEGYELYNFGTAAQSVWLGQQLTEEHCRRISEAKKGKKRGSFSQEWRDRISKANMGKHHTEEAKQKISDATSGENHYLWGKHHSEEARHRMSEAHKNRLPISAETRRRLSASKSKPYPAFVNRDTGKIMPAGINLTAACQERGLNVSKMCAVKNGRRRHHRGWILLEVT